ncbi:MAG: WD40 repeat domain-containing protein [Elusimicrobiales bacterium]|nr:WD40 repeat domain-containing protein [Elusimicrobiales bacterium]
MNETVPLKTLTGHNDGVLTLAFSPCGKFLATAGEDNTIRLWDNPDGIQIQSIQAHKGDVRCVAFDPDGDVFASASWDKTIKIWQTSDCSTLAEAAQHEGPVNCLAFSPDGKLLYSGSDDATIKVFSSPKGSLKDTFKPEIGDIKALAVSSKGLLAAGGSELQFLDDSGKMLKDNDNYLYGIKHLAFSPDGKMLAAATGMEKRLEIWNAETLEEAGSVKDTDWINCVAFTMDGKHVVTGGTAVKIWDPVSGTCVRTLEGHTDEIYDIAVSPDGKYIASASNDKTVKLWAL